MRNQNFELDFKWTGGVICYETHQILDYWISDDKILLYSVSVSFFVCLFILFICLFFSFWDGLSGWQEVKTQWLTDILSLQRSKIDFRSKKKLPYEGYYFRCTKGTIWDVPRVLFQMY